jgi:hypothetical protein
MAAKRIPDTWRCPINHAVCGHACFLWRTCARSPAQVQALLDRIDPLIIAALHKEATR